MRDFGWWSRACAVFVICAAATAIAQGQTFTSLYSFTGPDGADPSASLTQGEDGNFYGTAAGGGISNGGTVFRIMAGGVLTTLYSFCTLANCIDGRQPAASLALAEDGNFYGTTESGGANGWGTVFRITPAGILTTLYSFCTNTNCPDGAGPYGGLVQASDGNLYGTTEGGGASGRGTVFRITTEGTLRSIHSFCRVSCVDGYSPRGNLIQATDGNLYGTTSTGGNVGNGGTVFRIRQNGAFAALELHEYAGGGGPMAGLVQASDGSLYGTTYLGGYEGDGGTVFKITPAGAQRLLYQFCAHGNCSDGEQPTASLIQATDGDLYGTATIGGDVSCEFPGGCGTVFQIRAPSGLIAVHTFEASDGFYPVAGLLQATSGLLYGTTEAGGGSNAGTVFSLDMGLGPFIAFVRAAGKVGQTGGILGQGFTGTTSVSLNGIPASFTVVSDTFIKATVPAGATTGYVTVTTPTGVLTSNVPFQVIK